MRRSGTTWAPLRARNYRLFFTGQLVSVPGTWLQQIAQAWLVLSLTGSGTALGATVALQTLPVLLLGAWGGALADRVDRRRALLATQAAQGLLALVLGLLVATGAVRLWMVFGLALGLGLARTVDSPVRQSFVSDMVGPELLPRAIALNSTVVAAGRMIGPATGGAVIATLGVAPCFLVNAASFLGPLAALVAMRADELHSQVRAPRASGQVRAGLAHVAAEPLLRTPLLMMVLVGTFAYEFQVTLPLLARTTFGLGAAGFGALYAAMGAGAVASGLTAVGRRAPGLRTLALAAAVFGALLGAVAASPAPLVAGVLLAGVGAASVTFSATTNSLLQLVSDPAMRGRVMALYLMAFMGTTPIGGPIVGAVGEWLGPRWSLALGGAACLLAAGLALAGPRARWLRAGSAPVAA